MRIMPPPALPTRTSAARPNADIPRGPAGGVGEREAWVLVLYQGGASVYEIAALLGAGREWVRQCVLAAGLPWRRGVRQVDALAILREVRRPDTLSLKAVAARLGYSEETVRQSVMALGMSEAVRRLLRLRRRSA